MAGKFTLGKEERLKSRKQIGLLFRDGRKISVSPFYIYYLLSTASDVKGSHLQSGVSVPSKNFKKAVDRNRIKRLIREAYRLQKIPLQEKLKEKKTGMMAFFIYTGKELPGFDLVKEKVGVVLNKLEKIVNENSSSDT
ncbi:MAG: ribonuclease P protein component [Chitinophagaceae bacterium]|nr:ribonuclease P protein component [Chitinophagaceae bacterium]OQY92737.1 MAG: ribonuclease P protein component [Sphingobacteriales bacterium UTBCD1]